MAEAKGTSGRSAPGSRGRKASWEIPPPEVIGVMLVDEDEKALSACTWQAWARSFARGAWPS
jgi:hypothetical protein